MKRTSLLLFLLLWHTPANAQRAPGGIALGLHGTRFPNWSFANYSYRSPGLLGASLSVFPVWRVGIRASAGVVPRYYGEDNGFDLLEGELEGRIVQFGRLTPFASVGYGAVVGETLGLNFRYVTAHGGLYLRLFGPLGLRFALSYVVPTSWDRTTWDPSGSGPDTHLLGWQLELHWRVISFGR